MPRTTPAAAAASAPITFVVPGTPAVRRSGGAALAAGDGVAGTVKAAVRVQARRAGGEMQRVQAVPGEDLVVLRLAEGPALVLHPATARDLMLGQQARIKRSGTATEEAAEDKALSEVEVSAQLRWAGLEQAAPTRSGGFLGEVLLSGFEVVTSLFKDQAVDRSARAVVAKVDGQVEAGVYRLERERLPPLKGSGLKLDAVPKAADGGPILVLVHGTFVDTASTFGKLWAQHPQRVAELFAHYGGRVYALDHPTLGESPIANALTLAEALPAGARLHLLTHSRGGLVAEVLARVAGQGGVSADELALFDGPEHAAHRRELKALAQLVAAKRFTVERVVRVACPARGTLLASRRLDAYLSVLRWTLQLAGLTVLPALLDFLSEVARVRAEPEKIPGLAAMIPDTPLVTWLNAAEEPIPGQLRVLAGDIEGDGLLSWLKTLLADAYYWTDNDIVVQTRSMYGGTPRDPARGSALYLLDRGPTSTHFGYFGQERSVKAVLDALLKDTPDDFRSIGPLSWAGRSSEGQRGARRSDAAQAADRPAVFVLPGILGSHLKAGDKRIWLSLRLLGGLSKLAWREGDEGVQPDGPIGLIYDALIDHLADTHEVIEFAFDWRRPIEDEAARLARALDAELDRRGASGQPVRIVAHSMGGVLARTVQLVAPATFERLMKRDGARLLMLGTPNGGSWAPMQVLSGDDTFGNTLAAFGSPLRDHAARQLMAGMPGFLQLQAGLLDTRLGLHRSETWQKLADDDLKQVQQANWWHAYAGEAAVAAYRWGVPSDAVLQQAVALRRRLDAQRDGALAGFADRLLLVVGKAEFTPDGFAYAEDGAFVYLNTRDGGDGRVPLASALLPGVRTWTLDAEHGSLPDVKKAFAAFSELLETGDTRLLEALAPVALQRGAATAAASIAAPVKSRPSRGRTTGVPPSRESQALLSSFFLPPEADLPTTAPLKLTVLNSNLSFVRTTLMVGHSMSMTLAGSEAVANRASGDALRHSLEAGLYPDQIGTHQLFVNQHVDPDNPRSLPQPQRVLVVGLGEEGKLTEQRLTDTVRQGTIAWVQRLSQSSEGCGVSVELTATLMGSGGPGMTPAQAARAIAVGVQQASERVAAVPRAGWPRVARLTLVELYLERASEAWNGLQVLAESAPGRFEIEPVIASGVGPLRRQLDAGYRGAGYDFVSATSPAKGTIAFALDTRRARTEVRAQSTQLGLIQELVKRAATEDNDDPRLGRTLLQLLVPPEVEPFFGGSDRLLLELDDKTAAIPWELLDTQALHAPAAGGDDRPWAIRTALLRKLRTTQFRQQVQDARADDAVLVIGEPKADPSQYVPLPGARAEAAAVAEAFSGTGGVGPARVTALLGGADATDVINALFERRYRIVHVAGHGVRPTVDPDTKAVVPRGVVLSDDTFLGPDEIRAMRTVPELVFVNCCHLAGRDARQVLAGADAATPSKPPEKIDRAAFAASVAEALIGIGVRCVVAAGWAVDDRPAQVFAETFYRAVLARRPFVEAVAAAREAAWNEDRRSLTWAAYQAYGDPNWVYRRGAHERAFVTTPPREEYRHVASALGLALALEELAVKVQWMGADRVDTREKLAHLEARFAERWGGMGAVAEAFGVAYKEAGDTDAAIRWYERALVAADGSATLRAQEQLGNLRARRAWLRAKAARPGSAEFQQARDEAQQAHAALAVLATLQASVERHALTGSAAKRLGLIERLAGDTAAAERAFADAAAAYAEAWTLAESRQEPEAYYPGLNRLSLELAAQGTGGRGGWTPDPGFVAAVRLRLEARQDAEPDFWAAVGQVELDLLLALAARRLASESDALLTRFTALHDRLRSVRMWGSVADNADLVLPPHAARHGGAEAEAAQRLLKTFAGWAGR